VSAERPVPAAPARPDFAALIRVFARIGVLSFGGPSAQIALMQRELVDRHRWISERDYLTALGFCMLLPGPEAMQLATFAGWRLHGVRGGLAAGLLFVLPGAAVVLALSAAYATWGQTPLLAAAFLGIKAAVLVIVIEALQRVARRALKERAHWIIAALAFAGIFALGLPFPLIIIAAGLAGAALLRGDSGLAGSPSVPVGISTTLRTVAIWLAVWLVPLAALHLADPGGLLAEIGLFFSKLAMVTFGGAYAVLAYMAQEVVQDRGWLTAGEMLDGLGLAETTPGPLILVTEFVAYLAGFRQGGPWLALAAAATALWMTFAPCFLWIFAGAPYVDGLGSRPRLRAALDGITAAVVGVILNLAVWFFLQVAFTRQTSLAAGPVSLPLPDLTSLDWRVAVIAPACAWALLVRHLSVPLTLALAAACGLALHVAGV
jgi:chromate transporter